MSQPAVSRPPSILGFNLARGFLGLALARGFLGLAVASIAAGCGGVDGGLGPTPTLPPPGTLPGSACRQSEPACDQNLGGASAIDMECVQGTCLIACGEAGSGLCQVVSDLLGCSQAAGGYCVYTCGAGATCAEGYACFSEEDTCLPLGGFPSSPCRDDVASPCDQDLGGDAGVDMRCVAGTCVIDCATGGDLLCRGVSDSLTCSAAAGQVCVKSCRAGAACAQGFACFPEESSCLPQGAFPGSPCRDAAVPCDEDLGGNPSADMVCRSGLCVVDCQAGGDALCQGLDASLACSAAAGAVCVKSCVSGACDAGFACLASEDVCLPVGAFPGSPCRADPASPCDQDLGGDLATDMVCLADLCLVHCNGGGDDLCLALDASLTCSLAAGGVCVPGCDAGACDAGFSCLTQEGACLPTGSFPGSPCRNDDARPCDDDLRGDDRLDLVCVQGTCVVDCRADGLAACKAVDDSLTCSLAAGGVCVPSCPDGKCIDGMSCLSREGACLPTGAFPGSPCRAGDAPCDQDLGGEALADMSCVRDTCVIGCATGGEALCVAVDAMLTCSQAASQVCVARCGADGSCEAGFDCFERELACLPTGAFPGSPCRQGGRACDVDVGDPAFDLTCSAAATGAELCLFSCPAEASGKTCELIDPSLTCAGPDFGDTCLPRGTFPGSPCRSGPSPCDHDLGLNEAVDMRCVEGTCVIDCTGKSALCAGVDPRLGCSEAAGEVCVKRCDGVTCEAGFACLASEGQCLPVGSFPGSPCGPELACAQDLLGLPDLDMVCAHDLCLVDCGAGGDFACGLVNPGLGCSQAAGALCVPRCVEGQCPAGLSCLSSEARCLPTGSFPGSPCRADHGCDGLPNPLGGELAMACSPLPGTDTCLVDCSPTHGGQAVCSAVSPLLVCVDVPGAGTDVCVPQL